MSVASEIKTALKQAVEEHSGVYIVKYRDIYDSDYQEFIIGVGSTYDEAVNIIKEEIKNVCDCYFSYRFYIENWELDKRYMGGLTDAFTKEQNFEWAKELGVFDGNNN